MRARSWRFERARHDVKVGEPRLVVTTGRNEVRTYIAAFEHISWGRPMVQMPFPLPPTLTKADLSPWLEDISPRRYLRLPPSAKVRSDAPNFRSRLRILDVNRLLKYWFRAGSLTKFRVPDPLPTSEKSLVARSMRSKISQHRALGSISAAC